MYDWVSHTHSHLGGECTHKCSYCYVQRNRFGVSPRYKGKVQLFEDELKVDYGIGKTIFIEHMNDLFAEDMPGPFIYKILIHTKKYPGNLYIFQTKNPQKAYNSIGLFPANFMIGTTIETNAWHKELSKAPEPYLRYIGLSKFVKHGAKTFLTIEPIIDFDLGILMEWITDLRPDFVNIGADSKSTGLPEPDRDRVLRLINGLELEGITIKKKTNLDRILNPKERTWKW